MGVPIDSILIEIESSSDSAVRGIDALAKSLEGLKKNGSFKTVSNNLNNLSAALKNLPNVHQASNALRTLANSIERLKGVGSVASLSNSLAKLPNALKSLENINLGRIYPQIISLVDAMTPLTQLKGSGFSSMVNAMAKIEKVTDSLDSTKITAFANKVKELNDAIEPFATKMGTIQSAFKGLNTAVKQTNVSIDQANAKVNVGVFNFSNFANVISVVHSALQSLITGFSNVIHAASQWDGVKYQFGNAFGEQADEYYEKITKITEALDINMQTFMEHSAMSASMLIGFGVDRSDAREMGVGYTELAYDIWAAYNNVYESLTGADGAMAAIRSAISGEVEPIRRAGFTIVESQLEQTAANHGLEISIYNATEAQKSYLRYLTLVDQAQSKGIVGAYAREMNTAEGMMRTFSQQLKSLTQAFGSLFLPMLVKVMPYLQAFVELLTEAVRWVAGLFGIEIQDIGETWNDYSSGVSDAVENTNGVTDALKDATTAAKELKNASIGIDELNVISPPSASSGGSGSGGSGTGAGGSGGFDGLDIESLWDQSIFDSVQSKVDEIKTQLKGMFDDWLPTLKVIGTALAGWTIAGLLEQLGDALQLSDKFSGAVTNIRKLASSAIIIAIQFKLMDDAFSDYMSEDGTILDYITGVLIGAASTYLLYKQWGVGGLTIGLGITAVVSLKTVMEQGGITDMESAVVAITGLAAGIGALASAIKALSSAWAVLKGSAIVTWLVEFATAAKAMAPEVGWMSALFPKLSTALSSVGTALAGLGGTAVAGIAAALALLGSTVYFVYQKWDELKQLVVDFFNENIAPKLEEIKQHFDKIKEALAPLDNILKPVVNSVREFFENIPWDKVGGVIGKVAEAIGAFAVAMSGLLVSGVFPAIVSMFENLVQVISGVIQTIRGVIDFIIAIFTGGDVEAACEKMISGIGDIFGGLWGWCYEPIVAFFEGVTSWFTKLWDVLVGHSIVPDTINAIVKWFTGLPGKVLGSVGNFVTGVVDKFSNLGKSLSDKFSSAWNTVKSWWGKKPSLSSYTPSIGSIYDKLKSRWDSARSWWNSKKSKLNEYTPSIGSIYEKVYARWKNARDWWNNKKGSFKSYTPSIGSITDKLKSAWNSAKSWWNKNVKLSTKLNIQVPTIKVKWDTASAFGKSFKYPTGFSLKFAADGGIFDKGSLIWAGERGPEVMANAGGGRTGVMNVQQMQEAVYEGVYTAVSAAMRGMSGNGGAQAVNVYLDGKQITAAVEQRQRERGASIMGNEVYSY